MNINAAKPAATPAHLAPIFHLMRRPASRCKTNIQEAMSGAATWAQYAAERHASLVRSNRKDPRSTRVKAMPEMNVKMAAKNVAQPARTAWRFGRLYVFRRCTKPKTIVGTTIKRPKIRCSKNIQR